MVNYQKLKELKYNKKKKDSHTYNYIYLNVECVRQYLDNNCSLYVKGLKQIIQFTSQDNENDSFKVEITAFACVIVDDETDELVDLFLKLANTNEIRDIVEAESIKEIFKIFEQDRNELLESQILETYEA